MQYLQGLYAKHYINPYVNLYITNKRLIVYRGNVNAQVISITNKNMTIAEAIAAAGGLTATGKSKEVKIVRQHADSLQLSKIDLTTLEGIQLANTAVQPNDIIYIESNINSDFIKEAAPVITTLTSLILVYIYINNLNKP
jgi:protein involved in polysaccharide export with SLBB domain